MTPPEAPDSDGSAPESKEPEKRKCDVGGRYAQNMSMTHQGLKSGVGAGFKAAKFAAGVGVGVMVGAKLEQPGPVGALYQGIRLAVFSAPTSLPSLGPLAGAAEAVTFDAVAVGVIAAGATYLSFEGGIMAGSFIESVVSEGAAFLSGSCSS